MLRGLLYEPVQADPLGATVRLLPESAVYAGHFPGYPITPGVCLVQIALDLIGEMAGRAGHDGKREMADQVGHDGGKSHDDRKSVHLVAAKSIKFTSPVIPEEGMELRFNLSGKDGNWGVEVYNGEVQSAKMTLTVE